MGMAAEAEVETLAAQAEVEALAVALAALMESGAALEGSATNLAVGAAKMDKRHSLDNIPDHFLAHIPIPNADSNRKTTPKGSNTNFCNNGHLSMFARRN